MTMGCYRRCPGCGNVVSVAGDVTSMVFRSCWYCGHALPEPPKRPAGSQGRDVRESGMPAVRIPLSRTLARAHSPAARPPSTPPDRPRGGAAQRPAAHEPAPVGPRWPPERHGAAQAA